MAVKKRVSTEVTDPTLKAELLNITEDKITSSFIFGLFGEYDGKCRCNPYDILKVPPGYYGPENHKNKNQKVTGAARQRRVSTRNRRGSVIFKSVLLQLCL